MYVYIYIYTYTYMHVHLFGAHVLRQPVQQARRGPGAPGLDDRGLEEVGKDLARARVCVCCVCVCCCVCLLCVCLLLCVEQLQSECLHRYAFM